MGLWGVEQGDTVSRQCLIIKRLSGLAFPVKLVRLLVIEGIAMQTWPVQDAKSRFSEFLQASLTVGPQLVTRRGIEAAVLVSAAQWRQLQANSQPSLKQMLLDSAGQDDLALPQRGSAKRRPPVIF
jgi:prevent-host-death family protein